jgi:hypothetical protein
VVEKRNLKLPSSKEGNEAQKQLHGGEVDSRRAKSGEAVKEKAFKMHA